MCGRTLSFSVLRTVGLLIKGGAKGAMMEASTRVMGMSAGKTACSMASLSMVSQKSSTCTSSESEHSGQVNCRDTSIHHKSAKQPPECPFYTTVISSTFCHLHVLQLQDVVRVPQCDLEFWSNATDAADHIVVISYRQTLKGPVATQEKLLDLTWFFRT